jgi:hypothetical protein
MASPKRSPMKKAPTPSKKAPTPKKSVNIIDTPKDIVDNVLNKKSGETFMSLRWAGIFIVLALFVVCLVLSCVHRAEAQRFYALFGGGSLMVLNLWYVIISIVLGFGAVLFLLFTAREVSLWYFVLAVIFAAMFLVNNLLIYVFIPRIVTDGLEQNSSQNNTRVQLTGIFAAIPAALLIFWVYNNNKYPILSFVAIGIMIAVSCINLNLKIDVNKTVSV